MRWVRRQPWAVVLLGLALAGCFGGPAPAPAPPTASAAPAPDPHPGIGVRPDALSRPVHGALPAEVAYVAAADGVLLHVETFRPDGDGPWPAILTVSPFNEHGVAGGDGVEPALRAFWVPRGYAVVVADARGTGESDGCLDFLGPRDQEDAAGLVEWAANQSWSSGRVGLWGIGYAGALAHAAAIRAPAHLAAVATVAAPTDPWRDVYLNGVPYTGRVYPLTYSVFNGARPPGDASRGPAWAANAAAAACEQGEAVAHAEPRAYGAGVYDAYWRARNLTAGAANVTAPVFYSQGLADRATNPSNALDWFNALAGPKKAFLGPWNHALPDRKDWSETLHAWFDEWLLGVDTGVRETPVVEAITNRDTIRVAADWPPANASSLRLHLSPDALGEAVPSPGAATYRADLARGPLPIGDPPTLEETAGPTRLSYVTGELPEPLHMAGAAAATLRARVDHENTYFLLSLYDVAGDEWTEVAEGWMNAHLWRSAEEATPLAPGEDTTFRFGFQPQEHVFEAGHRVGLRILGHDSRAFPGDEAATENTIVYGGDEPSRLEVPVLDAPRVFERPPKV